MNCLLTQETRKLLGNMRAILKSYETGCEILFDQNDYESGAELCATFHDEEICLFFIPADCASFYNYTADFKSQGGIMLYEANDDVSFVEGRSVEMSEGSFTTFDSLSYSQQEVRKIQSYCKNFTPVVFKLKLNRIKNCTESTSFKLLFESNATHYKYYFFYNTDVKELEIVDVNNEVEFSMAENVFDDGRLVKVFVSNTPISNRFQSRLHFQLLESGSANKKVIRDNLPLPQNGHYHTDVINGQSVIVSEVFIN